MKKVWLRDPDGELAEFDPREYDVPRMLADGFTRAKAPEPGALRMLPAAGSLVGGIAGAPAGPVGMVGGAALGAAGGEAFRQHIGRAMGYENVPDTPQEAIASMGGEAAWGAGSQVAGMGLAKGASAVARPLMQAAMRSTPEVAQTALRQGVIATRGGLKRVEQNLADLGARAASMVRQNRTRFEPDVFLAGAERKLAKELAQNRTPGAFDDSRVFQRLSSHFLSRNRRPLSAPALHRLKQMSDDIAKPLWDKAARGEPLTGNEAAKARWYKAVADHARTELERTTPKAVINGKAMTMREANAETAETIRLKEAIGPTRKAPGMAARIAGHTAGPAAGGTIGFMASGHDPTMTLLGAAAGAGATSPAALSALANALNSPAARDLLLRSPQALRALGTPPYPDTGGMP